MATAYILQPLAKQVRPLLTTMIPATATLPMPRICQILARVDDRLATEPAALQAQLRLFVRVLWWLPVVFSLRTLGGLEPARREKFLLWLQDCPVAKLRVGLWGLRTLLFLGWYGDPDVQEQLGYTPNIDGWAAWHAAHPPSTPEA